MAKSDLNALETVFREISQSDKDESNQKDLALIEKLISLADQIDGINNETIVPLLHMIETYDLDLKIAERAYRPDLMEKELKIDDHIGLMKKAMESLLRAKEYKRFYARRQSSDSQPK